MILKKISNWYSKSIEYWECAFKFMKVYNAAECPNLLDR